ncbi:putative histidine kinase [Enterococcus thailandicus]|nr:putative histidine kinase [Enterococcus thailandicus]
MISAFLNFTEQSINTIIFRNYSKEELIVSVLNIIFLTFNIFIIRVAKPDKVASMRDYLRPNKYLIPMILINIFLLVLFSELTTSYAPIEFIQDLFLNDKGLMYLFFSLGLFTLLVLIQFGKHHTENEQNILLLRNLSDYNNEIERLNDDLAMFRHDYLNILHTLRIAIANEDLAQIKDTYEHVLAPTEKFLLNISKQNTALSKIKNIEIKSLVSYKYEYAKRRNLSVFLSINQPIFFDQTVDLVMLVRILSILLDNAIENTIPTEDKSLWISINKDINSTNFIIENSFEGTFPEMNKKKERYTTKSDKNNHGLGLLYVNQITKENDNYDLETTIENQIFSQKLTIKI